MYMRNRLVGDVFDVITCASLKMKFPGATILQGVEFSIFLLMFEWALQR